MSVVDLMPQLSDATVSAMVQAAAQGLGYQTATQVQNAINGQAPPIVLSKSPIRFSVKGSDVVLGTSVLFGLVADRTLTLSVMVVKIKSLVGLGAGLTVKIQVDGVDVPGASATFAVSASAQTQAVNIPNAPTVSAGQTLEIVFVGVGAIVAGVTYGYVTTTS